MLPARLLLFDSADASFGRFSELDDAKKAKREILFDTRNDLRSGVAVFIRRLPARSELNRQCELATGKFQNPRCKWQLGKRDERRHNQRPRA